MIELQCLPRPTRSTSRWTKPRPTDTSSGRAGSLCQTSTSTPSSSSLPDPVPPSSLAPFSSCPTVALPSRCTLAPNHSQSLLLYTLHSRLLHDAFEGENKSDPREFCASSRDVTRVVVLCLLPPRRLPPGRYPSSPRMLPLPILLPLLALTPASASPVASIVGLDPRSEFTSSISQSHHARPYGRRLILSDPPEHGLYVPTAQGTFRCLDGSKVIPFKAINDDYCDCPDGSDEPGAPFLPQASSCSAP